MAKRAGIKKYHWIPTILSTLMYIVSGMVLNRADDLTLMLTAAFGVTVLGIVFGIWGIVIHSNKKKSESAIYVLMLSIAGIILNAIIITGAGIHFGFLYKY